MSDNKGGSQTAMKRLHIITKPTTVDSLQDIDEDSYTNRWQLKAEQLEVKRLRKFKQQLA
jgi:hypothetical protein